MENSIWRCDVKHEDTCTQTMWRIAYGDMMSSMWRMPCKPAMRRIAYRECHAHHVENSIWRHDVEHEDTCTNTIWRIAYGDVMSSMWRMPCKPVMRRIAYGE